MTLKKFALVAFIAGAILVPAVFVLWKITSKPALNWHQGTGYRWVELSVSGGPPGLVQLHPDQTGITSTNTLTREQITENRHLLNGSGVALGDVDGDGWIDVYLCRLDGPNKLYKNLGDWRFRDITEIAGVACPGQFSTGCVFADVDGDGDLDLLVTALGGPNACFLNDGTGRFSDVSETSGIISDLGAKSLALADVDGDGDLDLYIANYKKRTVRDLYATDERTIDKTVRKVGDTYEVLPEFKEHYTVQVKGDVLERFEYAEPDRLLLNDGQGRFTKAPPHSFVREDGQPVPPDTDWGLSVRFQDMNGDGAPDIYVCNDFESPDRIWINDGRGVFKPISKLAIRSISASSMGVDFSDVDRDGDVDFFLAEMLSPNYTRRKTQTGPVAPGPISIGAIDDRPQYMRNMLFINRGENTYAEIAFYSGLEASEWSWTPLFADIDLDGFEDLLIVTGHYYDAMDADTKLKLKTMQTAVYEQLGSEVFAYPRLETPNFIFRNRGDLTFEDRSTDWGFTAEDIGHGMAAADLDNDGHLDVVTNRLEAEPGVFRNEAGAPRIAVRLIGEPPNTQAIGARIRVLGGPVSQSKEVFAGGHYLSHSDTRYAFATGDADHLTIEITWPDGERSVVEEVESNRIYEIFEAEIPKTPATNDHQTDGTAPYFEDVSHLLNHRHAERPYDDFQRQPLLPYRLSQLGPAVAWHDLDSDDDDDLVIGSGAGGRLGLFRNNGDGTFTPWRTNARQTELDHAAVLPIQRGTEPTQLLVAHSNYESENGTPSFVLASTPVDDGDGPEKILELSDALGPMATADYDGDGDLDLFAGARVKQGRYPEPMSSRLYLNQDGEYHLDENNVKVLKDVGLVTAAVFSDIDGDGDADLVLAREWGSLVLLKNEHGVYRDVTQAYGLDQYTGWWNGVTTGDFNEDGRMDIVATNWGLNTKYRATRAHPRHLFYEDFDNNGTLDVIEAYFESSLQALVPERGAATLTNAIPFIRFRTPTHAEFARASLEDLLGFRLNQAGHLTANTLAHTLFLNQGDGFDAIPLPPEAQRAPAFYVGVSDFDGDGHDDLFISQNFFAYPPGTSRSDAGRGLWLKGDGRGNLHPVPGHVTGVKVYGEQRGAALADFDGDARVDLAVSQNGAATKLYRNLRAKPGLRIKLRGPKANPAGIGAVVRLVYEDGFGPAREIHAGSGYWSHDSPVPILGYHEQPTAVQVRWCDGETTTASIPDGAREVIISYPTSEVSQTKK